MGAHNIFSESWTPPILTMLQNTTSKESQGVAVSLYSAINLLTALVGTLVIGWGQQYLIGAEGDVSLYGTTLAALVAGSYLLSLPFIRNAGVSYNQLMLA